MPNRSQNPKEGRVLILMPQHKDAFTTAEILRGNGIASYICTSLAEICNEMIVGASCAILTEEAILSNDPKILCEALSEQPSWSYFPLIVLTPAGNDSAHAIRALENIGDMTLIKRPLQITSLLSSVRAALRDRQRQYLMRSYLLERDIQAEQLMREKDKAEFANLAKSDFLATMSHEIRTPMNAIIGLSTILGLSQPLSLKQKEFVGTLQSSAQTLLVLINDLLDIEKIEAQNVELEHIPFNLGKLIKDVVGMMALQAQEKGILFETDIGAIKDKNFIGDPTRLRQVITNLCSNAIKFTAHGKVKLSIQTLEPSTTGTMDVYISVADTGTGVPADKLETIFEKFTQADSSINRKFGGTGLGLAISKTLIELMNGKITVESIEGEGSNFIIYLPLPITHPNDSSESTTTIPVVEKVAAALTQHPKVLIVEDYKPNILVATSYLEEFGYVWDIAMSGLEALDKTGMQKYSAILMDVQMQGMNGFQATSAIRENEKKTGLQRTPIIGMTAHALAGDKEKCLESGMDDYLSKPFNPDALREKLTKLISA